MITLLAQLWHDIALRHGAPWREITADRPSYKRGVVIECPCGRRWLSRAPWDRVAGFGR